jgi:ribose-phosphate pyrophosphokinase
MSSKSSVYIDARLISSSEYTKLLSQINKSPMDDVILISGRSCRSLSESLSKSIGKPLTNVTISTFANSEINVIIHETVREKNVFVIQTGSSYEERSINDHIMEAMLIMDACKRSGANRISIIMPTFAYARSDKKDNSRVPI